MHVANPVELDNVSEYNNGKEMLAAVEQNNTTDSWNFAAASTSNMAFTCFSSAIATITPKAPTAIYVLAVVQDPGLGAMRILEDTDFPNTPHPI